MPNKNKVPVKLAADLSRLTDEDFGVLRILKEALGFIDRIYLLQRGQGFYPPDLTAEEFERYVEANPAEREALESPFTLVRRGKGTKRPLVSIRYADAYPLQLREIRVLLRQAAQRTAHIGLRELLLARADSLRSNDYDASEGFWIMLHRSPIEVTLGPAEEYDDKLLGLKRSFEAMLGAVITEETDRLRQFQVWAGEFDHALRDRYGSPLSGEKRTMVVIDELANAGFMSRYEITPVGSTLPNGEEIRRRVGSKVVLMRNVNEARFEYVTGPIARRLLEPELASRLNAEILLFELMSHELAHGLGLYFKSLRPLRELVHPLEEAKADVFGSLLIEDFADRGCLPAETAAAVSVIRLVDGIRQIRLGEAHGLSVRIQLNWAFEFGVIEFEDGFIRINEAKLRPAFQALADEFARLIRAQDYDLAKAFIERWSGETPGLERALERVSDVPVDITPVFPNLERSSP